MLQLNTLEDIQHAMRLLEDKESADRAQSGLLDYCQHLSPQYMRPKHIEYLASKLEAVERGEISRLAISMPPRHGKSELASNFFQVGLSAGIQINTLYSQPMRRN